MSTSHTACVYLVEQGMKKLHFLQRIWVFFWLLQTKQLQTHVSHIYSNGVRQCIINYSSSEVAYHGGAQEGIRVKTKLCWNAWVRQNSIQKVAIIHFIHSFGFQKRKKNRSEKNPAQWMKGTESCHYSYQNHCTCNFNWKVTCSNCEIRSLLDFWSRCEIFRLENPWRLMYP